MAPYITDNGAITIYGKGKSDVLLFLRGLGTITEDYRGLLELLAEDYEVVVPTTSKMKEYSSPQPKSIDEYFERLQKLLIVKHKICAEYGFGHSLGGHLILKEPLETKKNIAISPIVPVDYGLLTFLSLATYQGAKACAYHNIKGVHLAKNILCKATRNIVDIAKFADNLKKCSYSFEPKHPTLVIEAQYDEFFSPTEKSKKLFKHENITHKIVPRNHSWPNFHPKEVHEEITKFIEKK